MGVKLSVGFSLCLNVCLSLIGDMCWFLHELFVLEVCYFASWAFFSKNLSSPLMYHFTLVTTLAKDIVGPRERNSLKCSSPTPYEMLIHTFPSLDGLP